MNQPRVHGMSASKNYIRRIHRTGISTHICHENHPNLSKYTIHYIYHYMLGVRTWWHCTGVPKTKDLPRVDKRLPPAEVKSSWKSWKIMSASPMVFFMGNLEGTRGKRQQQNFMEWDPYFDKKTNKQETYVLKVSTLRNLRFENALFVLLIPILSMYGIFTYIWLIFRVNVGKYIVIPYMDPMGYDDPCKW